MTCDVLYGVADDGTVKLDDSVSTYVAGVPQESDDHASSSSATARRGSAHTRPSCFRCG